MSFACLIPYHRVNRVQYAIKSALDDGWKVEAMLDKELDGVCKIREALLNRTFVDKNVEFIRYLDDDDLLLPHREKVEEIFNANPKVDIVYMNYVAALPNGTKNSITFTGNPIEDCLSVHPWVWVARTKALHRIKDVYGYLWDYNTYREGGNTWFNFLQLGVNILHIPIEAYQYNVSSSHNCVSNLQGNLGAESLRRKLKMLKPIH